MNLIEVNLTLIARRSIYGFRFAAFSQMSVGVCAMTSKGFRLVSMLRLIYLPLQVSLVAARLENLCFCRSMISAILASVCLLVIISSQCWKTPSLKFSTLPNSQFVHWPLFKSVQRRAVMSGVFFLVLEESLDQGFEPCCWAHVLLTQWLIPQPFQLSVLLLYPLLSKPRHELNFRQP